MTLHIVLSFFDIAYFHGGETDTKSVLVTILSALLTQVLLLDSIGVLCCRSILSAAQTTCDQMKYRCIVNMSASLAM